MITCSGSCYAAEQRALRQEDRMGAPRVLNFYGSQLNRISDRRFCNNFLIRNNSPRFTEMASEMRLS